MRLQLRNSSTNSGFTLIELLVVAPVAIIAIATLISLMVGLVGDVVISKERSSVTYSTQDALDKIEQDARVATLFMQSYNLVTSPQGRNGSTGAFNISNGDIIFTQYATTGGPYDANRNIVYYADQPNPCGGAYTLNRALTVRVIYFLSSGTLWRRTIVPDWSTTATDTTKTCAEPWQRDSCPASTFTTITATCKTRDEKMVENVSSFSTTYYTSTGATTSDPTVATSLKVTIATSQQIAGETLTNSATMRAYHTNTTTDTIPVAPNVYVYNEPLNVYNNPILTTFAWDPVASAGVYGVRYKINGGGWVTMPDQTGTQFVLNSARPLDAITLEVTAKNDMGTSSATSFSYTKPLWTYANLENDWGCYQSSESTWPCPKYTISSAGVVLLRGLATAGSAATSIFTLPAGLRPNKDIIYPAVGGNPSFARVDVSSDGRVIWRTGGSSSFVSLDNVRFLSQDIANPAWITNGYGAGWTTYGGIYGSPQYVKDSLGRVHEYGLVKGGDPVSGANTMITTNSGYSPSYAAIFTSATYPNATATFQVQATNAVVSRYMGSSSWMSIAAMYHPASSSATWTALPLTNGWINYGGTSYAPAGYTKASDGIVTIRGLIKSGTVASGTDLGTLPAGYCPTKKLLFGVQGIPQGGTYADQTIARIDIEGAPSCTLTLYTTSPAVGNGWLSLEGINFMQEQ